jgi:accessory gene regulator protein AgrB
MVTKNIFIGVADETFTTNLILNIDYYGLLLVSVLYFSKKGEHIYELVIKFIRRIVSNRRRRTKTFSILLPKRNSKEKNVQQNVQEVEPGYVIFSAVLSVFQILLVGFLCYLVKGTVWNFIFIFGSFVMLRFAFGKSWHAETVIWCTTVALFVYTSGTKLSLDINISILSCVLIGLLIAFILHILYFYKLRKDFSLLNKEDLAKTLSYLNCTEIDILYDYYHRGNTSVEEIADKYGYNKMKIYRILNKIKKEND